MVKYRKAHFKYGENFVDIKISDKSNIMMLINIYHFLLNHFQAV